MKEKNGGPAFPVTMENTSGESVKFFGQEVPDKSTYFSGGMTLRDYFAGQALLGLLSHDGNPKSYTHQAATEMYQIADVMIAEREKGGE